MGSEYQMQQFINKPDKARLLFAHESYKYSKLAWRQSSTATHPPDGIHTTAKKPYIKELGCLSHPTTSAVVNLLSLSPTLRRSS